MTILLNKTFTAAESGATSAISLLSKQNGSKPVALAILFNLASPTGGTSVDAYVQMTFDGGLTWMDVANFHGLTTAAKKIVNLSALTAVATQATPGAGVLAANTAVDGFIGQQCRVQYVSVGTYNPGAVLTVNAIPTY